MMTSLTYNKNYQKISNKRKFVHCFCLAKIAAISVLAFGFNINSKAPANANQLPQETMLKLNNSKNFSQFCKDLPGSQLFVKTELFLGLDRADGSEVSSLDFNQFLARTVTPKFPDGLTLLSGRGQFRSSNGKIIKESANLLILIYPFDRFIQSSKEIKSIRQAYKQEFKQESVLRTDDLSCVSL
jgi:Protein of unknown function (DUF3574)